MIRAVTALLYLAERRIEEALARGDMDESAERAKARKKLMLLGRRIEARYYDKALAKLGA